MAEGEMQKKADQHAQKADNRGEKKKRNLQLGEQPRNEEKTEVESWVRPDGGLIRREGISAKQKPAWLTTWCCAYSTHSVTHSLHHDIAIFTTLFTSLHFNHV